MNIEHESNLKTAYKVLCYYNLYRRGKTEENKLFDPVMIGGAIDTAAGAILDLIGTGYQLEQQKCITRTQEQIINARQKEITRLRAILAAHKISYRKKK